MSTRYWKIIATDEYIDVVSKLSVEEQENIQRQWIELSQHKFPREAGETADCGSHTPFVLVIFPGVRFEFVYEIRPEEKEIWLISCKPFKIRGFDQD